jgi:pimeloyl-ACP methyl ester carboxylesterase
MSVFGSDTWMRAGREIEAAYRANGAPIEVLATFDPPTPFLHLYAQSSDPAILQAQTTFAENHPWFTVHRVDAQSHSPQFEVPGEVVQVIEEFAAAKL